MPPTVFVLVLLLSWLYSTPPCLELIRTSSITSDNCVYPFSLIQRFQRALVVDSVNLELPPIKVR